MIDSFVQTLKRLFAIKKGEKFSQNNNIPTEHVDVSTDFLLTISCGPLGIIDRTDSSFCVYVDEGTLDVGSEVVLRIHNSETRIKVLKIIKQWPNTNAVFDGSADVRTATSKESNIDSCNFWIELEIGREKFIRLTKGEEPILCGDSYSPSTNENTEDESANYYSKKGMQLVEKDLTDKAIQAYKKAVEIEPMNADFHFKLGIQLGEKGHAISAKEELKKAMEIDPMNADFHFILGVQLGEKGDAASAKEEFKKAIEIDPMNADAYAYLGAILFNVEASIDESIEAYNEALRINPSHEKASSDLEWILDSGANSIALIEQQREKLRSLRKDRNDKTILE